MKSALALVVVLGLIGVLTAFSTPSQGKVRIKTQPVAALNTGAVQSPGSPAIASALPGSPSGWLVQSAAGSFTIPHVVHGPPGFYELDHGIPGGMTMHGLLQNGTFGGTRPVAWIKVRVNGPSEVHIPGRSGFGIGPATPGGSFTLSNGFTVTAIP